LNLDDQEVQDLIMRAEDVLAKLRKEKETKVVVETEEQKLAALKNAVLSNFRSVASAGTLTVANNNISNALKLFASEDIPVLIIISQENGMKDYDRPTTIIKYLEYLKDVKNFDVEIENMVLDNNRKITEIELIKK